MLDLPEQDAVMFGECRALAVFDHSLGYVGDIAIFDLRLSRFFFPFRVGAQQLRSPGFERVAQPLEL
jgi:hypothetical protein